MNDTRPAFDAIMAYNAIPNLDPVAARKAARRGDPLQAVILICAAATLVCAAVWLLSWMWV